MEVEKDTGESEGWENRRGVVPGGEDKLKSPCVKSMFRAISAVGLGSAGSNEHEDENADEDEIIVRSSRNRSKGFM